MIPLEMINKVVDDLVQVDDVLFVLVEFGLKFFG